LPRQAGGASTVSPGAPGQQIERRSIFVKMMDPDAKLYIDVSCAFEAAQRASDLGIGQR